jgi:hypothetical protein
MFYKTMIVLATAAALTGGLTADAFARGGGGGRGGGRGGFVRSGPIVVNPAPQIPFENRIPAPLAAPAQAPVINGPMSQPAFRGLTGIGE